MHARKSFADGRMTKLLKPSVKWNEDLCTATTHSARMVPFGAILLLCLMKAREGSLAVDKKVALIPTAQEFKFSHNFSAMKATEISSLVDLFGPSV